MPYFDTDSVIYTVKPAQPDIPLGDYLGEMTDKLVTATSLPNSPPLALQITATRLPLMESLLQGQGTPLNVRESRQLNYDVMR